MFSPLFKHKIFLFWATFVMLLGSMSIVFIFENQLSDGLAISSSILAGIAMFVIATILVLETVLEICNP